MIGIINGSLYLMQGDAGNAKFYFIPAVPFVGDSAKLVRKLAMSEVANVLKAAGKVVNSFDDVAAYVQKNGKLPDNFISKNQANALGWNPNKGNLADVAPGMSIGGDVFKNAEGKLPSAPGRVWYEADINYTSGFRGGDRIIYSNDGLIYKTTDHYSTFTQINR